MKKSELRQLIRKVIREQASRGKGKKMDPLSLLKQNVRKPNPPSQSRAATFIPKGDGPTGGNDYTWDGIYWGPYGMMSPFVVNPACQQGEDYYMYNFWMGGTEGAPGITGNWDNILGNPVNYGNYCESVCSPAWSQSTYNNSPEDSFLGPDYEVPPAFWSFMASVAEQCYCCPDSYIPSLEDQPNHMTGVVVSRPERPGTPTPIGGSTSHGDALQEIITKIKNVIKK